MPKEGVARSEKSRIRLECPNCHQEHLARIARRGFFRNRLYPLFGYYPWQCAICGKQYLLRKRSSGYGRVGRPEKSATENRPMRTPENRRKAS